MSEERIGEMTEEMTEEMSGEVPDAEARDLAERRPVSGVTIDDDRTRDIDDAIWIERRSDERWDVFVSIADVAAHVPIGGDADRRAQERGSTRYFASGNRPMLPRSLSEGKLSLWPGKPRRTITIEIGIDPRWGHVLGTQIYPSTLVSRARCAYERVPLILTDQRHPGHDLLVSGAQLATRLLDARRRAGAMAIFDLNHGWISTEEGFLRRIERREETIGHVIVQELMVLANAQVAQFCVQRDVCVPFRNHMAALAAPDRSVLLRQLEDALQTPIVDLDQVRHRTHLLLGRASYGIALHGHYGLNLPAYAHATSPIRRYADLVTQRQLKADLAGLPPPYTPEEVEQIALRINQQADLARDETSRFLKHRDEAQARQNIDERRLDGLDAVHFDRATKVMARAGGPPSPAFADAFVRRLGEGRVSLLARTIVLTRDADPAGWEPIRRAIVDRLVAHPEDAVSILTQAAQVAGWASPTYEVRATGPDHARAFDARAKVTSPPVRTAREGAGKEPSVEKEPSTREGEASWVGEGRGSTQKQARARAAVDLIARACGCPIEQAREETREATAVVAPASVAAPVAAPIDDGRNPISLLMEYAQRRKVRPPDFQFVHGGPAHVPTIECTCAIDVGGARICATGKASSKAEAKKIAAAAVLRQLPRGSS